VDIAVPSVTASAYHRGPVDFQTDRLATGFTHSGGLSGDKLNALESLWVNAMQHGMLWIGLAEMVEGTAPEKVNRLSSYSGAMAQTDWGQEVVNDGDR
jgi:NAD(P)H dehydrogenase (quinone)